MCFHVDYLRERARKVREEKSPIGRLNSHFYSFNYHFFSQRCFAQLSNSAPGSFFDHLKRILHLSIFSYFIILLYFKLCQQFFCSSNLNSVWSVLWVKSVLVFF